MHNQAVVKSFTSIEILPYFEIYPFQAFPYKHRLKKIAWFCQFSQIHPNISICQLLPPRSELELYRDNF